MTCLVQSGMRLRRRIKVSTDQLAVLLSPARYKAFIGGRGAGKSVVGALLALQWAGERPCTGIISAPTYQMLSDGILPVFRELAAPVISKMYRSLPPVCLMANGSKILFRSADDPDRLRGGNNSWFIGDEWGQLVDDYCWKIILATLREGGRRGKGAITTTPNGKNWLFQKFVVENGDNPDFATYHGRTMDNPFTSQGYKDDLKRDYGVGYFERQELEGEFCDPLGAIFRESMFKVVEADALPPFEAVYRGWDLAATAKEKADYTVGVKVGITADEDIYILNLVRGQWEWPEGKRVIVNTAKMDGWDVSQMIESVAFQKVAAQELKAGDALPNHHICPVLTTREKKYYALPVAARGQAGKLYIVRAPWNVKYVQEMCMFTGDGKGHDDQVDATTIATRDHFNRAKSRMSIV